MTLTYIFHSGFVLETEQSILVFDYWLDPSGVMDSVIQSEKPMYVFSSHFHEDHFTKDIFEWKKQREGVTYILSKDIYKHRRASKEDADVWLAKGGIWSDDTISVWALGSTDSGVSWIVETEDKAAIKREQSQACLDSAEREQARPKVKRIFHAGDLNNWYAKFLTDDNPDQQRYSFEMEETFNPIAHESILDEEGNIDLGKLQPVIFDSAKNEYRVVGEKVGTAWGSGKTIQEREVK